MDPNETLKRIRTVAYRVASTRHDSDAVDLANMFLDLDAWILNDGFLPDSWLRKEVVNA